MNTRLKTCPYCANEYCEAEIGPNDYGERQPTDDDRKIGWYQGYVKHP